MPKKPPEPNDDAYFDGLGNKIPPEKFENDLPFTPPENIDRSPGSDFDRDNQRVQQILENIKDTR